MAISVQSCQSNYDVVTNCVRVSKHAKRSSFSTIRPDTREWSFFSTGIHYRIM